MIYVGLDDTDTLDDPGTNQLARHLVRELAGKYSGRMILRHQLLEDPRVPCTKKNGCASLEFEPLDSELLSQFACALRDIIIPWCPTGSDPGLCVTESVPPAVVAWGLRCQRELVTQDEARRIAAEHGIHLEGLGGTQDGVIGALAAVGLMDTKNDGRVVYFGPSGEDWYEISGPIDIKEVLARGVDEIRDFATGKRIDVGTIDVGKRLRPNYRQGSIVLYTTRVGEANYEAVRIP